VTQPVRTTTDHDLHLITDKGQIIHQARAVSDQAMFMIPNGVKAVRLVSRTSRPSDAIGPFVDDRRELGVLVGSVTLWDSNLTRSIDTLDADLVGWSVVEASTCRWTLGDAWLPLGDRRADALGMLGIQILAAGPYVATDSGMQAESVITA